MTYKVFQWASGGVGAHAARAVLSRIDMSLVGLHVASPEKVGQKASDILGANAGDIEATNDVEQIIGSDADLVIHAPLASKVYGEHPEQDLDDICTLLAAGKNVITVVGYLYPQAHGREVYGRLVDACLTGGATFHGTGLNPGWMGDLLPLAMSALCREIDDIHVLEITNFQHYPSPEIMFGSMGFGSAPAVFETHNERRTVWLNELFNESITLLADGCGLEIDEVTSHCEIALAEEELQCAAGTIESGSVAGQHWTWTGQRAGQAKVVHETVWRMHHSVEPSWPTGTHEIRLTGAPNMHLKLDADYVSDGLLATAMHAVNAVAPVCVAPAGVKTLLDLPMIVGHGSFGESL